MLRSKLTGRPAWAGAILVTLLAASVAFAALTGSMTVTVKDKDGAPVPGATVTVTSPAQLGERSGVTNAEGLVRLNALQPGDYKVVVAMQGFATRTLEKIPVKLDENRQISMQLNEEIVEQVTVTSKPPVVDTTSTQISQDLSRTFVDSLPIGRDYLANFQRVPGVGTGSNPAVRGGTERDNLYLIDGVNTTDPVTGTFGTNINFEIIDQQSVTTGGHMAEYGGVVGMVSNVITKSGGNDWSGSLTYFRNDADWTADPKEGAIATSKATDYNYAYTLGGPIIKDRMWHFTSWQKVYSETETVGTDGSPRPPREFDGSRPFAKVTWQITPNHRTSMAINAEDAEIINVNAADTNLTQDQFYKQTQGGPTYTAKYTGLLGSSFILEGQLNLYRGELDAVPQYPELPANTQVNTQPYQFGRYSNEQTSERNRDELRADLTWFKSTSWGDHNLKVGAAYVETDFLSTNINSGGERYLDQPFSWNDTENRNFLGHTGVPSNRFNRWRDIAHNYGWGCTMYGQDCDSITIDDLPSGTWDPAEFVWTINGTPYNAGQFQYTAQSQNAQAAEIGTLRFFRYGSELGNTGSTGQKVWSGFVQDDWRLGKWSVRAGLRIDKQNLVDSFGNEFYKFDPVFGPRLGITYDPMGDGKSKIFVHAGRLYDPLRDNTSSFAGTVNSPLTETQLWLDGPDSFSDNYYSFLIVGGPGNADAVISPTIKTPKTDELILGYSRDLGGDMSIEVTAFMRKTKDVTEDFDPVAYEGFGFDSPTVESLGFGDANGDGTIDADDVPAAFIIYNPPGAERKAKGFDITFTKRFSNKWQGLASYSYMDGEGNVPDDGLYGAIGDDPFQDPRFEYNNGQLAFARKHFFQAMGSYRFDFGLTVGVEFRSYAGYNYGIEIEDPNSYSGIWDGDPAKLVESLGITREDFGGATDEEIVAMIPFELKPGRGAFSDPWFNQWNLRLKQDFPIFKSVRGEVFLDVFNVMNRQKATQKAWEMFANEHLDPSNIDDPSAYYYNTTLATQRPRSYQAGLRVAF